jgi:hypothetical protein
VLRVDGINGLVPRRFAAATGALLVVAGICSAAALAASSAPSGNKAAIKFYRQSQSAMAGYQGISFTGSGVSYEILHQPGFDNFKFDFGSAPKGFTHGVADVLVVQRNGLVTQEVDTLRAPGLPALRLWHTSGLVIGEVMDSRVCAVTVTGGSSFVTVGGTYVGIVGRFAALKRKHGNDLVRTTYAAGGGTAHEADTIDASNGLWKASTSRLRGGPYSGQSLSESGFKYSHLQQLALLPQLGRCP